MTDNDISRYDLELVRSNPMSDSTNDIVQSQQSRVVYVQPSEYGMLNPTIIVIFAILLGIVAGLTIANTVNKR
jgi:hypothetical protein